MLPGVISGRLIPMDKFGVFALSRFARGLAYRPLLEER
jgi:hypothetical protein